jgi:flavin-dependent thymidylate synthase
MNNEVSKWADSAMFRSESHKAAEGPKVHLLAAPADPLGQIAACGKMYKGEVVRNLADVTEEERLHFLEEMKKTKLKMPLEAVTFHFMIENVTRAFTHQLVRQRTAAYAQESMRFAVVEDMNEAVALPPSLAWANERIGDERVGEALVRAHGHLAVDSEEFDRLPEKVKQFLQWRNAVVTVGDAYMSLVNSGIPAEDARGLMPTNIITRINYITNLRGLLDHAGNRLCTQAQFEWRIVFAQIANALRTYGKTQTYAVGGEYRFSAEQYEAIAALLQPVCYQIGKCAFEADFDRFCSIRSRVQENAGIGRPSSEWDKEWHGPDPRRPELEGTIYPIHPEEWLLDPSAARSNVRPV